MNKKRTIMDAATAVRSDKGIMLVEMLVAVLILSIAMASIMQGLSQMSTAGTGTQNQIFATSIIQELVDQARNASWNDSGLLLGLSNPNVSDGNWHDVGLYSVATGQPAYLPRPLGYTGATQAGMNNQFRGTVRQRLVNLGGGQVQLTIEVTWPSERGGGQRSATASCYISQYGIHN